MADSLHNYISMANEVTLYLSKSIGNWSEFLRTLGNVYKYPFLDQLMIFAQAPSATAVAEKELWTKGLHRRIKPQAQGITLFLLQDGKPIGFRVLYDVADTEGAEEVRPWRCTEQYHTVVCEHLAEIFNIPADNDFPELLIRIALKLAAEYWKDNAHSIVGATRDSLLEELDEQNIGIRFTQSLATSLAYVLLLRCDQWRKGIFEKEDFQYISEFNTQDSIKALAMAVSEQAAVVLYHIEKVIKSSGTMAA